MPAKTTTQKGLGWAHQKQRERLLSQHVDGTCCWWCDRPMYEARELNWDREALAADHSLARVNGGTKADRLLHGKCNKARGDGSRDHTRPAATGEDPEALNVAQERLGVLAMPWP